MKKIFYSLIFTCTAIAFTNSLHAQRGVKDIFCENFDGVWQMDTSYLPNPGPVNHFFKDTIPTLDNSPYCAADTARNAVRSYLTSPNVSIAGFINVGIIFEHICYLDVSDDGTVEYSFDDGVTWFRFRPSSYGGNGVYDFLQGEWKFNKQSYGSAWRFSDSTYIWTNGNAQWRRESFDLTDIINEQAVTPTTVKIRFGLVDDPATPGRFGTHIWYIENFCIRGSDCEIVPPTIDLVEPPIDYPIRYEGRVYSTGPYYFDAQILDNSLIDTAVVAMVHLRDVTSNIGFDTLDIDTFPMIRLAGGNFSGNIPKVILGQRTPSVKDTVFPGDSIAWKVLAWDASDCRNVNQDPPAGYTKFLVINDLPKTCNSQPVFQYPYVQDFNGPEFVEGQSGDLDDGWSNPTGDFHDWWVNTGTTGGTSPSDTGSTGPSDDFPGGGKYLYVESTNPRQSTFKDSSAYLLSPCFDLTQGLVTNGLVKFYVNMNTSSLEDTINVDIYDATPQPNQPFGGFKNDVIPPIVGKQGDRWISFEFTTYPFRNQVTQLRFRGTPGNATGLSDMAIDSFKVTDAPLVDLRLNPVALAPFNPCGEEEPVVVNVQNLGVADAIGVTFGFEVCRVKQNGDTLCNIESGTYSWPGTVPVGESVNVTFPPNVTYTVPEGNYFIKTYLSFPGDGSIFNDTTFALSECIPYVSGLKYRDNFDKDTLWKTVGVSDSVSAQNSWELGTPNFDRTNHALTDPNAWDVLLDRQYTGSGVVNILYTPLIDLRGADSTIMSFLNNRDMDTTKDGVFIEYSFDKGITWDSLGRRHDPGAIRWYNATLSSGGFGGTPVFSDMTGRFADTWKPGWLESELVLPDTFDNQQFVLFRFNFFAENDLDGNDGMSIDNFLLYDPDPIDLEPQYSLGPNDQCNLKVDQKIQTIFKNRGLQTINSFDIEYRVRNITTNSPVEVKTETINRVLLRRDTLHVLSSPTFNMFAFGDYEIKIIAKATGDGCPLNDTLTRVVENIDGCSFRFEISTSGRFNPLIPNDSTVWEFNYTSGGRSYREWGAYNDPKYGINTTTVFDTIRNLFVCIKSNSQVRFDLDDRDSLVGTYSMIAFDGAKDTIVFKNVRGGPESPTQFFNWYCPPDRSAAAINLIIDNGRVQLPIAKEFGITMKILNNGLDSMDFVTAGLLIDGVKVYEEVKNFSPPLRYNNFTKVGLGRHFVTPGRHILKGYTKLPNGQQDELPGPEDTTTFVIVTMDTVQFDTNGSYCEDFEGPLPLDLLWISGNSYTYRQSSLNNSFQLGKPNTFNINAANSGQRAWVTNKDGNYPDIDESSVFSPWLNLQQDSCYKVSFYHNYHITDSLNDGGTMEIGVDTSNGRFPELPRWSSFGNFNGDSGRIGQTKWFNTRHILSMPDIFVLDTVFRKDGTIRKVDTVNLGSPAGWTGNSGGWIKSENVFPSFIDTLSVINDSRFFKNRNQNVTFRWRFESDGSQNSDGWAIDDFCIERIDRAQCFSVGLSEMNIDRDRVYLGQNIPNPSTSQTTIPFYLPQAGNVNFVISNMLGQAVYNESQTRPSGDGILELDVSELSGGIYYYTMWYNNKQYSRKMIVTK